jgi:hypothetical protein
MPPIFMAHIQEPLLVYTQLPFHLPLRGFHPLGRYVPVDFASMVAGRQCTHISAYFRRRIRFALCRVQSPLLAASQLISLPADTKTFQFSAFALLTESMARSHSDIPGSNPACGSPGLSAACHILHRQESQAIHRLLSLSDHSFYHQRCLISENPHISV